MFDLHIVNISSYAFSLDEAHCESPYKQRLGDLIFCLFCAIMGLQLKVKKEVGESPLFAFLEDKYEQK